MKKLVVLIAIVAACLLVYNHETSGRWTLVPGTSLSPAEQQLANLEEALAAMRAQAGQAGRGAALAGLDTTADVESARRAAERLQTDLRNLKPRLETDAARRRADALAEQVRAFLRDLA